MALTVVDTIVVFSSATNITLLYLDNQEGRLIIQIMYLNLDPTLSINIPSSVVRNGEAVVKSGRIVVAASR